MTTAIVYGIAYVVSILFTGLVGALVGAYYMDRHNSVELEDYQAALDTLERVNERLAGDVVELIDEIEEAQRYISDMGHVSLEIEDDVVEHVKNCLTRA